VSGIFVDEIPTGAPVVVVLAEQAGCEACEQYHPVFVRAAAAYARDLPIYRLDVTRTDAMALLFMNTHGIESTPTVIIASFNRYPLGRLEGVVTETETRRLLDVARAHNRPREF
jgi:thioredoxin-like negative regulator of GroEL